MFEDAASTYTNACLVGPPTVEFAPYGRTPGGRRRVDARAGTIDQDPEFMAFLEGLANPSNGKEAGGEGAESGEAPPAKGVKVTTTPLVQFLKDKKASRNKEAAVKAAKKQEAQVAKNKTTKDVAGITDDTKKKGKDVKSDRLVDKAAREAVKILNREASSKASSSAASSSKADTAGTDNTNPPKLDLAKVSGRQRGAAISAHIRMLQRDLGLTPAQAHRQVRRDTADAQKAERIAAAAKADAEAKPTPALVTAPSVPTAPKSSWTPSNNTRGPRRQGPSRQAESPAQPTSSAASSNPVILLKKSDAQQGTPTPPTIAPSKPTPMAIARKAPVAIPSAGATQAFVKHANPSQGVTEPLLKEALEKFGAVSSVEIDKRKGFAYVEFADNDGLRKAMAANPISVAQGTVHVMQRKGSAPVAEKKPVQQPIQPSQQIPSAPANMGGGRGNGRPGRGGTVGRRGGRGRGGMAEGAGRVPPSVPTGPSAK